MVNSLHPIVPQMEIVNAEREEEIKKGDSDDQLAVYKESALDKHDADVPAQKKGWLTLGKYGMVFAAGTSLFSDGYSNGVVGQTNYLLKLLYPVEYKQNKHGTIYASMAFAGIICGQLGFGWVSDKVGRKSGMLICSIIIMLFSALSAGAYGAGGSVGGLLAALSAYRFLVGIGIGGEYPSGSVACAENSDELPSNQKHMMFALATDSAIDWGFVASAFVPLVMLWICGDTNLNTVWRLSLGFGIFPALIVFIFRLNMREPTSYAKYSMKRAPTPYWLIAKKYWRSWVPLAIVWWIYDWISYPFGIYSSTVVDTIIGDEASIATVLGWSVVINLFYIPGTMIGALFLDRWGPKAMMTWSLVIQGVVGFIMSGLYKQLSEPSHIAAFAVVYGLFLSFGESGPGNCIGLLAAKSSPTSFRGQYYGTVAAFGKIGAYVGTWTFPIIIADFGDDPVLSNTGPFWVGSGLAIFAAIVTFFFIQDIGDETMKQRDHEFMEYLEAHGYDTSRLGLHGDQGKLERVLGGNH